MRNQWKREVQSGCSDPSILRIDGMTKLLLFSANPAPNSTKVEIGRDKQIGSNCALQLRGARYAPITGNGPLKQFSSGHKRDSKSVVTQERCVQRSTTITLKNI